MARRRPGLSPRERVIIQKTIDAVRKMINHPVTRSSDRLRESEDHQAPEVYIAKVPAEGIPAIEESESGDVPGDAECDIYRLGRNPGEKLSLVGPKKRVVNVTGAEISSAYVLVHRDKFGTWVAGSGGASASPVRWGRAKARKGYFETLDVDVWDGGSPSSGLSDPDGAGSVSSPLETLSCTTTYPTLEGVPGAIVPIPTFGLAFGDPGPVHEFRPFITHFYVHADADWTSGAGVSVTLAGAQGTLTTPQTFNAMAPQISGIGMGGVGGYIFGVYGQAAHWQFIPLGCVGTAGTGTGSG